MLYDNSARHQELGEGGGAAYVSQVIFGLIRLRNIILFSKARKKMYIHSFHFRK